MSMYAISLQPLISLLHNRSAAKQCWFADNATGAGPLQEVKQWWDELREAGPPLGYYPNSKKCWLVVKPEKEGRAKEMFAGSGINITTEGRKHLGAALGSRSFLIFIFNCKVLTYNTYLQTMYDTYATNRTILYLQKKLIYNVRYLRY